MSFLCWRASIDLSFCHLCSVAHGRLAFNLYWRTFSSVWNEPSSSCWRYFLLQMFSDLAPQPLRLYRGGRLLPSSKAPSSNREHKEEKHPWWEKKKNFLFILWWSKEPYWMIMAAQKQTLNPRAIAGGIDSTRPDPRCKLCRDGPEAGCERLAVAA